MLRLLGNRVNRGTTRVVNKTSRMLRTINNLPKAPISAVLSVEPNKEIN